MTMLAAVFGRDPTHASRVCRLLSVLACLRVCLMGWSVIAWADAPVVRATLFYPPTCPHCHTVINEVLPPLTQKYGAQFQVGMLDTTTSLGAAVYRAAVRQFNC